MEKVDAEYKYSELDNIPETVVSLRAAVRVQGTGDESNTRPVIETVTISVQQKDVLVKVNIIVVTQTVIPQITIALIIRNLQLNSKIIK